MNFSPGLRLFVPRPAPQKTRLSLGYQDLALRAELFYII
jgi:hypothetical protein